MFERCAQLTHSSHIASILKLSLKRSQRNIKHVSHTIGFACRILGQATSSSHPVTKNKPSTVWRGCFSVWPFREALHLLDMNSRTFLPRLQNDPRLTKFLTNANAAHLGPNAHKGNGYSLINVAPRHRFLLRIVPASLWATVLRARPAAFVFSLAFESWIGTII